MEPQGAVMVVDLALHLMIEINSSVSIVVGLGTPRCNAGISMDVLMICPLVSLNKVALVMVEVASLVAIVFMLILQLLHLRR